MKTIKSYFQIAIVSFFLIPLASLSQDAKVEDLKLFNNWIEYSNGENMLQLYLNRQAYNMLDHRDHEISALKTGTDWQEWQQKVKRTLTAIVGQFPEKTPLKPIVTDVIRKDGFRIEKIVFESMPGFYVTGSLFIPEGINEKRPAIIYVCGHTNLGFRNPAYQTLMLNLVKKGFVVFAIDPIGQGERLQYSDATKDEYFAGGPLSEHSYPGIQCFITGTSISKYFIWDGIRAIDYLQTRKEVDPDRLGITGRSGGGTQAAFIAAFDDRIKAAAPENYITSHRRLLESVGPQDAEQNFYHWISEGSAIEDLLIVRMPKPTLLVTTSRDMFSIQGTHETYQQVLKGYTTMGKESDFIMVEDNAPHASTKLNREATYRFFQKHLSLPGSSLDEDVEMLSPEELKVTKTGQVSSSLEGETVFDINKKEAENLYRQLSESRQNTRAHLEQVKKRSMELSGYHGPEKESKVIYRGKHQREGYTVGLYAIEGEGNYVIPLLLAVPDGGGNYQSVIYIHPEGKEQGIGIGGEIEKLVKQGCIVASPDLLGTGETQSHREYPGSHGFGAQLIGRSIVGIQAGDIVRVVNYLKSLPNILKDHIQAVAYGEECPALLHAAAYEPTLSGVALIKSPVSYFNITQTRLYRYSQTFNWGVAGALTAYDLPDLAGCIAPRKLAFIGLLDGKKEPATNELISDQMSFPVSVYKKTKPANLKIISVSDEEISQTLTDWLLIK